MTDSTITSNCEDIIRVGGYEFNTNQVLELATSVRDDCAAALDNFCESLDLDARHEQQLSIAVAAGFAALAAEIALGFGTDQFCERVGEKAERRIISIVIGLAELATRSENGANS